MRNDGATTACIVGVGASTFSYSRNCTRSASSLAAEAFKSALEDAGLPKGAIDGLVSCWPRPIGMDYDELAEILGLDLRFVNEMTLGRFVTSTLQSACMAIDAGLASYVLCQATVCFSQAGQAPSGGRHTGGRNGEHPECGLVTPIGPAAMAYQRYLNRFGHVESGLAPIVVMQRDCASKNAQALETRISFEDYEAEPHIVEPLRKSDCAIVSDGAVAVILTSRDRARDLKKAYISIAAMQGMRAGREEFVFAPRGLGVKQQSTSVHNSEIEIFERADMGVSDIDLIYVYDSFASEVLFALERFGFCPVGEGQEMLASSLDDPTILAPFNTSGGILCEAHVGGFNSIRELVLQLRGEAGTRQVERSETAMWCTCWGDAMIFTQEHPHVSL